MKSAREQKLPVNFIKRPLPSLSRCLVGRLGVPALPLVAFLGLVISRILFLIHADRLADITAAAQGVMAGTPHWRAVQNRLLGPYAVQGLSWLTGRSFSEAYCLFTVIIMVAACLVAFMVFYGLTRHSGKAVAYTFAYACLLVIGQDRKWLYVWDLIDQPVFLLFAYAVFKGRGLRFLLPLFMVELGNREAALFIPVWLILRSLEVTRKPFRISARPVGLATGVALGLGGTVYTKLIRDLLFKTSMLPGAGDDASHAVFGNHFHLFSNVLYFFRNFTQWVHLDVVVSLFLVGLVCYFWYHRQKLVLPLARITVLFFTMLACIVTFAELNETRLYLILIPFLLMFHQAFECIESERVSKTVLKTGL